MHSEQNWSQRRQRAASACATAGVIVRMTSSNPLRFASGSSGTSTRGTRVACWRSRSGRSSPPVQRIGSAGGSTPATRRRISAAIFLPSPSAFTSESGPSLTASPPAKTSGTFVVQVASSATT